MLTLKNITKIYQTGGFTQKALDEITVSFRPNEFVSILGQSGSGKTTMLNIIGGLDRYTSGDLIIKGKSTKNFKDKDWDSYRNHSIGFVFQSYNLIPHQSVLSNVEIALTLSGVSRSERKKRALSVLEKVGLIDHVNKRPNQLSGGQMQRVAIARALVNNPEILLADEPTGALDSETSIQIMELLNEIAKDKLVIMVTHNPELAEKYSTRIVRVKDGHIIDDSNPYQENYQSITNKNKIKRTKMSFWTAFSLSLNNLMTKKGRTILTAFAGSIGIIGIAMILSLSSGVQNYIEKVQEDTLTSYPLEINETSTSISSMIDVQTEETPDRSPDKVYANEDLQQMLEADIQHNDLKSYKAFIESNLEKYQAHTNDIQYGYPISLELYKVDENQEISRVNPSPLDELFAPTNTPLRQRSAISQSSLFSTSAYREMLDNPDLIHSQYDILKGELPSNANEVVIILDEKNELNDFALYALGLKNQDDLNETLNNNEHKSSELKSFTFDQLINLEFKAVLPSAYYQPQESRWMDVRENPQQLKRIVDNALSIKVVGIIKPKPEASSVSSRSGIGYTKGLMQEIIRRNNESEIIQTQLNNPNLNVFTNKSFATNDTPFSIDQLSEEEKVQLAQMSPEEITQFMNLMNDNTSATYEDNLKKLGYVDLSAPASIKFFAKSFEDKDKLESLIKEYNSQVEISKTINYTDSVGLIMSSVTSMVTMITYVLVAFVAISLIVSSIMIGIITYISVLERTKEIGILRAMGASKKDISRVFNAETIIEGVSAGILGILITLVLNLGINKIVQSLTDVSNITSLPLQAALTLILISTILTLIAGILPSRMAAKKDPVEALRSE